MVFGHGTYFSEEPTLGDYELGQYYIEKLMKTGVVGYEETADIYDAIEYQSEPYKVTDEDIESLIANTVPTFLVQRNGVE